MPYPPNSGYSGSTMFTQRHYIAVAAELREVRRILLCSNDTAKSHERRIATDIALVAITGHLSRMFNADNHNFKPDKFSEACDYTLPVKQVSMDIDK